MPVQEPVTRQISISSRSRRTAALIIKRLHANCIGDLASPTEAHRQTTVNPFNHREDPTPREFPYHIICPFSSISTTLRSTAQLSCVRTTSKFSSTFQLTYSWPIMAPAAKTQHPIYRCCSLFGITNHELYKLERCFTSNSRLSEILSKSEVLRLDFCSVLKSRVITPQTLQ